MWNELETEIKKTKQTLLPPGTQVVDQMFTILR